MKNKTLWIVLGTAYVVIGGVIFFVGQVGGGKADPLDILLWPFKALRNKAKIAAQKAGG